VLKLRAIPNPPPPADPPSQPLPPLATGCACAHAKRNAALKPAMDGWVLLPWRGLGRSGGVERAGSGPGAWGPWAPRNLGGRGMRHGACAMGPWPCGGRRPPGTCCSDRPCVHPGVHTSARAPRPFFHGPPRRCDPAAPGAGRDRLREREACAHPRAHIVGCLPACHDGERSQKANITETYIIQVRPAGGLRRVVGAAAAGDSRRPWNVRPPPALHPRSLRATTGSQKANIRETYIHRSLRRVGRRQKVTQGDLGMPGHRRLPRVTGLRH